MSGPTTQPKHDETNWRYHCPACGSEVRFATLQEHQELRRLADAVAAAKARRDPTIGKRMDHWRARLLQPNGSIRDATAEEWPRVQTFLGELSADFNPQLEAERDYETFIDSHRGVNFHPDPSGLGDGKGGAR